MDVRRRGLDIKAGAAKLKAGRAARLLAELVVRSNQRMATGRDKLWSPTISAARVTGMPRRLLPWVPLLATPAGAAS
jgi:hypothetical protein